MDVKVGQRLRSVVCEAEVIVVRAPDADLDVRCGGHPMVGVDDATPNSPSVEPGFDGGTEMGKRYSDEDYGLELLATRAGEGSLSLGDACLPIKDPKRLPASD